MEFSQTKATSPAIRVTSCLSAAAFSLMMAMTGAQAETGGHEHHQHHDHATHMAMLAKRGSYRAVASDYHYPSVQLTDQQGKRVALDELLSDGDILFLDFIYTSCTTICPVLSATMSELRSKLADVPNVRYVSISIDPEYDTPRRLADYAEKYGADDDWRFLTGSLNDIVAVQKSFGAYAGTKANHRPLTFLRGSGGDYWLRIDGMASAADITAELHAFSGSGES